MAGTSLEERVAFLESEIERVKELIESAQKPVANLPWWEQQWGWPKTIRITKRQCGWEGNTANLFNLEDRRDCAGE